MTQFGSPTRLSRRHVLRAAGVALTLPFFEAMLPRAWGAPSTFQSWKKSDAVQPRLMCCYIPNGVNIKQWVPTDSGANYTLSPTLEALKEHRNDFTVLSGLGHPSSKGGHSGADTWLTGANLESRPGADYTNSLSIDQLVADVHAPHTRYSSLQLSDQSGTGSAGHSHTLSFDLNGTPLPAENSPRRLSIGSSCRNQQTTKPPPSGVTANGDRFSMRSRTKRNRSTSAWEPTTAANSTNISPVSGRPRNKSSGCRTGSTNRKPRSPKKTCSSAVSRGMRHDRPMWLDVMLELTYLAFLTDTTRVITFEWSREAGGYGGGGENHHELSHHGGDEGMLAKLAVIDRFHLSRLGRFLELLKATSEADGHMLDRTMILFGSGMNSGLGGEHSPKNLPTLVAGGHKLGLKHGRHLAYDVDKHPPLANVLVTLAERMGSTNLKFSDATGPLSDLTS